MKNHSLHQIYRIAIAVLVFVICLAGATALFYFQTKNWVINQQHENMSRAQHQLDFLLANVDESVKSMRILIGAPCTQHTVAELRRQLAITPNVGNIELAKSGEVYCSSLLGNVLPGTEIREERSLYLTDDTISLPGHPFIVFHLHEMGYGLYTSTDGYYIRNILESASDISPVVLLTEHGWMAQDGTIHSSPFTVNQNAFVRSDAYDYRLSSKIDAKNVIAVGLKNGPAIITILIVLSAMIASASYIWLGRSSTPKKLLVSAMRNHELQPYFQPIVRGESALPVGCEVLVRWLHNGSIIPPSQFIPLAEQTGLILPLTRQLIMDVTDQFAISYKPTCTFYISFNISSRHLQSDMLESDLGYFLSRVNSNIRLVVEITEREIIIGNDEIRKNIEKLKAKGVLFALDDFGTGYSTLETLQHTPVEIIKIDQHFIAGIGTSNLCQEIIANIIDLARRIKANVVAEGVETEAQVAFLQKLGDMSFQGYLFSKPLPVNSFKKWLNKFKL